MNTVLADPRAAVFMGSGFRRNDGNKKTAAATRVAAAE